MRAPKKGGSQGEELSEVEKRAFANPRKPSKAKALAMGLEKPAARPWGGGPKGNMRIVRPTMGAGAKGHGVKAENSMAEALWILNVGNNDHHIWALKKKFKVRHRTAKYSNRVP